MRPPQRLILLAVSVAVAFAAPAATADPVGDFFKRIGRSLSKPRTDDRNKPQKTSNRRTSNTKPAQTATPPENHADGSPTAVQSPSPTAAPSATATPQIRRAVRDPASAGLRDIPYAVPVPNHPGFVTSPFAPNQGWVDVRGLPSGVEAKDPYTGKTFLTP